jgi:hypothetical protein
MFLVLISVFSFARIKPFVIMALGGLMHGGGEASGVQGASGPSARASESETRFTPIPVSTMNRVSVSPTQTGMVSRCIRYWNGTVVVAVEKIALRRVRPI